MKQNTKIIIGIALPVVVILVVLGSVLWPKLSFTPKYDFAYAMGGVCEEGYCGSTYYGIKNNWYPYKVVDGKIVKDTDLPTVNEYPKNAPSTPVTPITRPIKITTYPKIYIYRVANGTFTELSEAEIANLTISSTGSAADGTVVTDGDEGGRGLFGEILIGSFGGRGSARYLKNGAYSKKIITRNGDNNYYDGRYDFHFLGWVGQ